MITLDKIQELDKKIQEAVNLITRLKEDKVMLEDQLKEANERIETLEQELGSVKGDHDQIEEGILGALSRIQNIDEDIELTDHTVLTVTEKTPAAEKPVEREESVIGETPEEETETTQFSFGKDSMEIQQNNDQVNHSEPQQDNAYEETVEYSDDSDSPEDGVNEESRSEQDLDIF